ncbi:hypothetical protein [Streptomyces sp. Mg1]|uniref:hypothetical protein n=1 Tax=Streptomyces sp. Mg1 TaxID=465541 RepID=UPI00017F26C1|nr:hypothetical protein [Streptomyces sp. Mg1]
MHHRLVGAAVECPEGASAWAEALRGTAAAWGGSHGCQVALRTVPFAATPADAEAATAGCSYLNF